MSIISKESFEKLTEEEKKKLRQIYKDMKEEPSLAYAHEYAEKCEWLEDYFGKENLQPKIKTWEDLEMEYGDFDWYIGGNTSIVSGILTKKVIATLKIAKLIELGYGGMVTEEEWMENGHNKGFYSIWADAKGKIECTLVYDSKEFIAFHTQQQAEEFLSYPKNVELLKQYYMV